MFSLSSSLFYLQGGPASIKYYIDKKTFLKTITYGEESMCDEKDLQFTPFEAFHITELTRIMKRAFDDDAKRHLGEDSGGPPGYDNGDFLRNYGLHKDSTAISVFSGEKPIGAAILWLNTNGENMLGCMFVDPDYQGKGIGTRIWRFIEENFRDTKIWRTETPGFAKRNHSFYVNKCGFHIVEIVNPGDKYEENFLMEKRMM